MVFVVELENNTWLKRTQYGRAWPNKTPKYTEHLVDAKRFSRRREADIQMRDHRVLFGYSKAKVVEVE